MGVISGINSVNDWIKGNVINFPHNALNVFNWKGDTRQDYLTDYTKSGGKAGQTPSPDYGYSQDERNSILRAIEAASRPVYQPTAIRTLKEYNPTQWMEEAKAQAANDVNPYYSSKLQDYLKTVELRKARQQEDTSTTLGNLDTQGRYMEEDLNTNLKNIADTSREHGLAEAMGATQTREANKAGLAGAGLTFSGIGQEKLAMADTARRLALAAFGRGQAVQEEGAKTTAERGKAEVAKGKTQAQKALARFLEDVTIEEKQNREQMDYERQQTILDNAMMAVQRRESEYQANPNNWITTYV